MCIFLFFPLLVLSWDVHLSFLSLVGFKLGCASCFSIFGFKLGCASFVSSPCWLFKLECASLFFPLVGFKLGCASFFSLVGFKLGFDRA